MRDRATPRERVRRTVVAAAVLAAGPAGAAAPVPEHAARLLLDVCDRYPDHPGAMHYLIHANDESPQAIEYLVYAYLQQGADDEAAAQVERLHETARLQPTFKTAFHLASTRARYALERRAWREAMALEPRDPPTLDWDRFTWPEAVTWFARGLGAARVGEVQPTRAAARRLRELETAAARAGEDLFARNIRILRLGVSAWIAHLQGDLAHRERDRHSSIALMRQAVDLETATPKHAVTPAATGR